MATIYIDGKPYEVKDGQNLLQACLTLGFNLPYFCWHPAMGSVGACRQCAIKQFKDEKDTRGRIVMACMTPADEGTRISLKDEQAVEFRASVIEWLMINHPHDCPVCDEGSECHLQDMTVMTGHDYRECRFKKRTHYNQDLGPFINHEMNRCIQCYRCVRYYRDYAGGRDFNVFACHDHVYFGRCGDGVLENEFSGNLVEICPTGVFTDKTFKKHYTRKWDLQTAPSVCVHCALGCNTIPGVRYGELRRIRNRYNHGVNGYFLCDRGRYGYEFVNCERRIREPLIRVPSSIKPVSVSKEEALKAAFVSSEESLSLIGIGSPRASLEANFALLKLVGRENFYAGLSDIDCDLLGLVLSVLKDGSVRTPSLGETKEADAVLVLGEDVTNTAPVLALNLRQLLYRKTAGGLEKAKVTHWNDTPVREAEQFEKRVLYIATPSGTRLDDMALKTFNAHPDELARVGFAVASMLDQSSPALAEISEEERALADEIASFLNAAARPLIVSGTGCRSRAVIEATANVSRALKKAGRNAEIFLVVPEVNSLGLAMLGASGGLESASKVLRKKRADVLIVLENDLFRRAESKVVSDLLGSSNRVIAIDHTANETTFKADIVLPAAAFCESSGSLVSSEGRAQRFFRVLPPKAEIRESWRLICDMMDALGRPEAESLRSLDDIINAIAGEVPALGALASAAPESGFIRAGGKVPRQSHRYSGRTSVRAKPDVNEPKTPDDPDTPLRFSMEGDPRQPPPSLIPRFWAPGWNSVQALNKFQEEIAGVLRGGSPGVRLIEPKERMEETYFKDIPKAGKSEGSNWLFVPLYHIFGTEELSALSPAVSGLCPKPYVALHPEDASLLGLAEGDLAKVSLNDSVLKLAVRIVPTLSRKVAGLPVGLPGSPFLSLPASGTILKGEGDE